MTLGNRQVPETPREKIIRKGRYLEDNGETMAARLERFIRMYPKISKRCALLAVRFVPFSSEMYEYHDRSRAYEDIMRSTLRGSSK